MRHKRYLGISTGLPSTGVDSPVLGPSSKVLLVKRHVIGFGEYVEVDLVEREQVVAREAP